MEDGIFALNGRDLALAEAVWERRGLNPFKHSEKLLYPGPLGAHSRPAWRCASCGTVVIPPGEP